MNIGRTLLLAAGFLSGLAASQSYRLEVSETVGERWGKPFEAEVRIRSEKGTLQVRDTVAGTSHSVGKKGVELAGDDQHTRKFCLEGGPCREAMVVDFSYDGLQEALLGGRGERLHYIVLAECLVSERDRSCRWPHEKLGPGPILKLLEMGLRPRVRFLSDRRRIVVGPFTEEQRKEHLRKLRRAIPQAFTCEGDAAAATAAPADPHP